MKIITTKKQLREELDTLRRNGKSVGFVPTMGALHQGHIELVKRARRENDVVVASVFVNPTQFNDPGDLKNYPRTPEADARMLESASCDYLFLPEVSEMYPENETSADVAIDLGGLDTVMEGQFRPGHFNGVVKIVSRLFDVTGPCKAYFGEKDFQQLAIVRRMTREMQLPVEIIGCPIVRENDGLAMSSRNVRLTPEERNSAPLIYQTLLKAKAMWNGANISEVKHMVEKEFSAHPEFRPDYFEIADRDTLRHPTGKKAVACIAVFLGKVRLIDNILLD
ncbi:MAG: pantoate--beta-alanine ligase [Bacteroidia bacterium]